MHILTKLYARVKELYQNHGKHVITFFFVLGFCIDFFTVPSVSNPLAKWMGIAYVLILGLGIAARSLASGKTAGSVYSSKISSYMTTIIAFFSGSLLSYIFILFFRSSTFLASLPFFVILFAIVVANEAINSKKYRTFLDLSVLYFSITCLSIFLLPFIVDKVDELTFYISLVVAVTVTVLLSVVFEKMNSAKILPTIVAYGLSFLPAILLFCLYKAEAIPPIPVSKVHAGVYHDIGKDKAGNYELKKETLEKKWFGLPTYTFKDKGTMYYFSSVYAPASIEAPISHVWDYYDEKTKSWTTISNVSFPIKGGKENGYRGYSMTGNIFPGLWRVTIFLDDKRAISKEYFNVVVGAPHELAQEIR